MRRLQKLVLRRKSSQVSSFSIKQRAHVQSRKGKMDLYEKGCQETQKKEKTLEKNAQKRKLERLKGYYCAMESIPLHFLSMLR